MPKNGRWIKVSHWFVVGWGNEFPKHLDLSFLPWDKARDVLKANGWEPEETESGKGGVAYVYFVRSSEPATAA